MSQMSTSCSLNRTSDRRSLPRSSHPWPKFCPDRDPSPSAPQWLHRSFTYRCATAACNPWDLGSHERAGIHSGSGIGQTPVAVGPAMPGQRARARSPRIHPDADRRSDRSQASHRGNGRGVATASGVCPGLGLEKQGGTDQFHRETGDATSATDADRQLLFGSVPGPSAHMLAGPLSREHRMAHLCSGCRW